MRDVRKTLEAEVLTWPEVESREMMGCLCYFRGKRFFAFLITNGLVITKLGKDDRSKLAARPGSKPFEMSGRTASTWIQLPLKKPGDLLPILPYIRRSYEAASR
jgi:hypothetical protein